MMWQPRNCLVGGQPGNTNLPNTNKKKQPAAAIMAGFLFFGWPKLPAEPLGIQWKSHIAILMANTTAPYCKEKLSTTKSRWKDTVSLCKCASALYINNFLLSEVDREFNFTDVLLFQEPH